jgi:hypothetical protein
VLGPALRTLVGPTISIWARHPSLYQRNSRSRESCHLTHLAPVVHSQCTNSASALHAPTHQPHMVSLGHMRCGAPRDDVIDVVVGMVSDVNTESSLHGARGPLRSVYGTNSHEPSCTPCSATSPSSSSSACCWQTPPLCPPCPHTASVRRVANVLHVPHVVVRGVRSGHGMIANAHFRPSVSVRAG